MKQRIVVKIGSRLLTEDSGRLSPPRLHRYVDALSELKNAGHDVILVTSAAIAAGFERLGYSSRPSTTSERQACAAVGQGLLIEQYSQAFQRHNIPVGQVLLSRNDFTVRDSYNNALATLEKLLERGAIPIINENDTVAVEEINFGDNDILAALLSGLLHAHHLILLTDTDGLYDKDPMKDPAAVRIERVPDVTPEIEAMAGESSSGLGTGGMRSKIISAKRALSLGVEVFIGSASFDGTLSLVRVLAEEGSGTHFGSPRGNAIKRKRQWLAFHAESSGEIYIDKGATAALLKNQKSLLPAGVTQVKGVFSSGDVIEVKVGNGGIIGRGVVLYSSAELEQACGLSTAEVKAKLGEEFSEVIHRDNWVTLRDFDL